MIRTIPIYSHKFEGRIQVSDRRARVLCNAFYGLHLMTGLLRTQTEREITGRTIRFLRRHGLLYEDTLTRDGYVLLAQIKTVGQSGLQ